MGGILTLFYITFIAFVCGVVLVMSGDEGGRKFGFSLVSISIILFIIGLFVVNLGHNPDY